MLATLTTNGRASFAKAMKESVLHLAWGIGDEAWELPNAELPSLVNATALQAEVGRRKPSKVGFVEPSETGDIVVPIGQHPDGSVEVNRYQQVDYPTPFLYIQVKYDYEDASNIVIREIGLFTGTEIIEGLPAGQFYFTPSEIKESGLLAIAQILTTPINRSPAVRETIDFVLTI